MSNSSIYVNYYEVGNSLSKNIQALIGLIGIISNILAVLVFEQKKLKKYSYSIYWKLKACFDSIILLHTFRHWARHVLNVDIDLISPIFCHFNEYQPYVAALISLYMEFLITLDRLFTIVYPNRFQIIKQKRFRITAISLIIIYSLLSCLVLPLNYRLDEISGTKICYVRHFILNIIWFICLLNVLVVNIFINTILDFKIISHIIRSRGNVGKDLSSKIDRKFAISAIGLNIVSLSIKAPYLVGNLLSFCFNLSIEQFEIIFSVCLTIILLEKMDTFLINISVNSTFRQEFLSMVGIERGVSF